MGSLALGGPISQYVQSRWLSACRHPASWPSYFADFARLLRLALRLEICLVVARRHVISPNCHTSMLHPYPLDICLRLFAPLATDNPPYLCPSEVHRERNI